MRKGRTNNIAISLQILTLKYLFTFSLGFHKVLRPSTKKTWNEIVLLNWPGLEPFFALSDEVAQWQSEKMAVLQIPRIESSSERSARKELSSELSKRGWFGPKRNKDKEDWE